MHVRSRDTIRLCRYLYFYIQENMCDDMEERQRSKSIFFPSVPSTCERTDQIRSWFIHKVFRFRFRFPSPAPRSLCQKRREIPMRPILSIEFRCGVLLLLSPPARPAGRGQVQGARRSAALVLGSREVPTPETGRASLVGL